MEATEKNLQIYQSTLLNWWRTGGARSFVWREPLNRTPYRAVIAEMMLRRTRADQVVSVFRSFIDLYPTLTDALAGDPEVIKKLLWSLGLEWRANNFLTLLEAARRDNLSDFPLTTKELQNLPGIGDYVSNAVVCFAANDREATLIDTNVVRVLGRIFGLDTTGEARRRKSFRALAEHAVDRSQAADYHYAVLDFAAVICTARSPRCSSCPFRENGRCNYYDEVIENKNIGR